MDYRIAAFDYLLRRRRGGEQYSTEQEIEEYLESISKCDFNRAKFEQALKSLHEEERIKVVFFKDSVETDFSNLNHNEVENHNFYIKFI